MTRGEISRKLRVARHTVRHHARILAQSPGKQAIALARYERACALLVAHRLSAGAAYFRAQASAAPLFDSAPLPALLSGSNEPDAERQQSSGFREDHLETAGLATALPISPTVGTVGAD
jgi:hypothetical protein